MKILKNIAIPLFIFIAAEILFLTLFWEQLELKSYNTLFSMRGEREISEDVVMVVVDDGTFSMLDVPWPFPREYHARIIENLNLAGAKQIIFDILMTESMNDYGDSLLAATAEKYGNVIFAGKVDREENAYATMERIIKPIADIRKRKLHWAITNTPSDSDSFVRQYSLYQKSGEDVYYTLGTLCLGLLNKNYQYYLTQPDKLFDNTPTTFIIKGTEDTFDNGIIVPKVSANTAYINYYGPAGTFTSYSYSDVLDDSSFAMPNPDYDLDAFDELPVNAFRDKIVLIGSTVEELHDYFNTPFLTTKQVMPGVEIHANFIEMCLNGDFLKKLSWLFLLILHLAFAFGFYYMFIVLKPNVTFAITIGLMIFIWLTVFLLFSYQNLVLPVLQFPLLVLGTWMITLIRHYIKTSAERKFIRNAFQQYMAPELVNELLKNPKSLSYGGKLQEATVLFSDIRSFTTFTESHEPQETVAQLREYLTAMVDVILKHNGTLDKFVGDEIMALFGVPIQVENHALSACKVALEMRRVLNAMHDNWRSQGKDIFEIGIGVNSGPMTIGNLGSEQIFDYTAIGDNVNLGARLEAINKEYDTVNKIIISEYTYALVKDDVIAEFLDEVKVKGKNFAVKIYQLQGLKQE
ncbi:MAG: adenylate/guanylate cyclase domain-containing protein [Candidatus Cloacimonetes bacterium]|nr:adenylate/guanylate cyclase domain-containing protein [Candidatus Cloacimonadota bacterium]